MMSLLSPPNTQSLIQYKVILKRKANTSLKYERLKFPLDPTREKNDASYFKVQKKCLPLHTKLMMR